MRRYQGLQSLFRQYTAHKKHNKHNKVNKLLSTQNKQFTTALSSTKTTNLGNPTSIRHHNTSFIHKPSSTHIGIHIRSLPRISSFPRRHAASKPPPPKTSRPVEQPENDSGHAHRTQRRRDGSLYSTVVSKPMDIDQLARVRKLEELRANLRRNLVNHEAYPQTRGDPRDEAMFQPQIPFMETTPYQYEKPTPVWSTTRPRPTVRSFIKHYLPTKDKRETTRNMFKEYTKGLRDVLDPKYARFLSPFRVRNIVATSIIGFSCIYVAEMTLINKTPIEDMLELTAKNYIRSSSYIVITNSIQELINKGHLDPIMSTRQGKLLINEALNIGHVYYSQTMRDLSYILSGFQRAIALECATENNLPTIDHFSQTDVDISLMSISRYIDAFDRFFDIIYTRNIDLLDSQQCRPYPEDLGSYRGSFLDNLFTGISELFEPLLDHMDQFFIYFNISRPPRHDKIRQLFENKDSTSLNQLLSDGKPEDINFSKSASQTFSTDLAKIVDLYLEEIPALFRYSKTSHQPDRRYVVEPSFNYNRDFKTRFVTNDLLPTYLYAFTAGKPGNNQLRHNTDNSISHDDYNYNDNYDIQQQGPLVTSQIPSIGPVSGINTLSQQRINIQPDNDGTWMSTISSWASWVVPSSLSLSSSSSSSSSSIPTTTSLEPSQIESMTSTRSTAPQLHLNHKLEVVVPVSDPTYFSNIPLYRETFDYQGFETQFRTIAHPDYLDMLIREIDMLLRIRTFFCELGNFKQIDFTDFATERTNIDSVLQNKPYIAAYFNQGLADLRQYTEDDPFLTLIPTIFKMNNFRDRVKKDLSARLSRVQRQQEYDLLRAQLYERFSQRPEGLSHLQNVEYDALGLILDPYTGQPRSFLDLDRIPNRFDDDPERATLFQQRLGRTVTKLDMCILRDYAEIQRIQRVFNVEPPKNIYANTATPYLWQL